MRKKKIPITKEQREKCHAVIHSASVAAGGVGAAGAQIPVADNAVIVPIQVGMIIGLGQIFGKKIPRSIASGIIKSAAASFVGRGISQVLFGWIPGAGNGINTATAAGLTEAIGWMAVRDFAEHPDQYEDLSEEERQEEKIPDEADIQDAQEQARTERNDDCADDDFSI